MPVITKEELGGNPPAEPRKAETTKATADEEARAAARKAESERRQALTISATEARELGPNAVTRGALERAEAAVAGGRGIYPPASEQPARLTVDLDGKIIRPEEAIHGGTVLVGAAAEAYAAAHGGKVEKAEENAEEKAAPKSADKSRKAKPSTKAKARRR
jgi:hypothetical protein